MAEVQNIELKEGMPEKVLSLMEVSENLKDYPVIVRLVQTEHATIDSNELSEGKEILLERPKWLQFASVKILDMKAEAALEENEEELIKERQKYVGKKYLIPMGCSGTLKLIKKTGSLDRYVTIEQIMQDLPRRIRIDQETMYSDPEQSQSISTIAAGTELEVVDMYTRENVKYIKCKSTDTSGTYTFREDFPINCTAVEEPYEYTLSHIAESVLLPKTAQFLNVNAGDIVLKADDEIRTMLRLLAGPVRILNTSIRRNLFIAWTNSQEKCSQSVVLIPHKIWNTHLVQLITFSSVSKKQAYIRQHFGEHFDSNIVVNGLFMMKQKQSEMILLLAPKGNITEDDEESKEDCGAAVSNVTPRKLLNKFKGSHKPEQTTCKARTENKHFLQMLTEKARHGIDKVHGQISKRTKMKEVDETKKEEREQKEVLTYSANEKYSLRLGGETDGGMEVAKVYSKQQGEVETRDSFSHGFLQAIDMYKDRPLPVLPKKCVNVSDDDKLYDKVLDKEKMYKEMLEKNNSENSTTIPDRDFSDTKEIGKPNQAGKDFYSYTTEELVNCLKMCNLNKFATECHKNRLDGAFFRNINLDDLKSEFCLSALELCKVRKIIEEGWRPKLN